MRNSTVYMYITKLLRNGWTDFNYSFNVWIVGWTV